MMKHFLLLIVAFLVAVAQPSMAQKSKKSHGYQTYSDIAYKVSEDDNAKNYCKLDIYNNDTLQNCPVVIWFHGGGLTSGDKELPAQLKQQGMVVVGVRYRLLPKVKIDECLDDCAAAVAWTFRNDTL